MMEAAFGVQLSPPPSVTRYQRPSDPGLLLPDRGTLTGQRIDPLTGDVVSGAQTPLDDAVFMGQIEHLETFDRGNPDTSMRRKTITVGQALNLPYHWSEDKLSDVAKKMRKAGFAIGAQGDTFEDILGVWESLVTRASKTYVLSGGTNAVTPWDMLSVYKRENKEAGVLDANGNVVQHETVKSVNDLSEGQAWSILRTSMQASLGRDPSDQEVREFLAAANADAAADPTVTKRTTRTNEEGQSRTSESTTRAGYTAEDAQKAAYDDLTDSAEYADYQSASTYFNAMVSALGEVASS